MLYSLAYSWLWLNRNHNLKKKYRGKWRKKILLYTLFAFCGFCWLSNDFSMGFSSFCWSIKGDIWCWEKSFNYPQTKGENHPFGAQNKVNKDEDFQSFSILLSMLLTMSFSHASTIEMMIGLSFFLVGVLGWFGGDKSRFSEVSSGN